MLLLAFKFVWSGYLSPRIASTAFARKHFQSKGPVFWLKVELGFVFLFSLLWYSLRANWRLRSDRKTDCLMQTACGRDSCAFCVFLLVVLLKILYPNLRKRRLDANGWKQRRKNCLIIFHLKVAEHAFQDKGFEVLGINETNQSCVYSKLVAIFFPLFWDLFCPSSGWIINLIIYFLPWVYVDKGMLFNTLWKHCWPDFMLSRCI